MPEFEKSMIKDCKKVLTKPKHEWLNNIRDLEKTNKPSITKKLEK